MHWIKIGPTQYKALRDIAIKVPVVVSSAELACDISRTCTKVVVGQQHMSTQQQTSVQGTQLPPIIGGVHWKSSAADAPFPERRKIPPFPEGEVTEEEGEAYCKVICDTYPEVFDEEKGELIGAEAIMFIKEGHMDKLMQVGVRPPAKEPYGLEDQYNAKLDELLEDCVPVNGQDIIVAS